MPDTNREPEVVSDEMLDQVPGGADTDHQGWSDIASISSTVRTRNSAQHSVGAAMNLSVGAAKTSGVGSGD